MDVVVVGSCMTDLVSYVSRFPKPGETIHGHKFSVGFGGKGANQCIVASRLGAKAAMVAKVGTDTFGNDYICNFKNNGVCTDHVGQTSDAATGAASILVNDEGQNAIVIVSGANLILNQKDVEQAEDMIKSAKVMVCQLEVSAEVTMAALKTASSNGVVTIFNPAPGQENLDPEIFKLCNIICPNETEAEILTGRCVVTIQDAHEAIRELQKKGCRTVIITMGSKGCVFAADDNMEPVHVPVRLVKPIDTTGAGDAFVGALAYYLAKLPSLSLEEAIKRSCEIATISVQAAGTQTSYPHRADVPTHLLE